jgi:hypothetical protein
MRAARGLVGKIQHLIDEYGKIALVIYLVLWAAVILGTFGAIAFGFTGEKVSGVWAMLLASWVIAKITQIPRVAATIALTPVVASWMRKQKDSPAD